MDRRILRISMQRVSSARGRLRASTRPDRIRFGRGLSFLGRGTGSLDNGPDLAAGGSGRPPSNPVVLVPGYRDNARVFRNLVGHLHREGFQVHPVTLMPSDGRVPLDELARQVACFVEERFVSGQSLDLVGFSMGGIVLRYYLQRLGGLARCHRFVTLGSPHRGTWMAYGSRLPGVCQMRPGSDFLADLARDEELLDSLHFTSLYTPLDMTIVPSSSSVLPVGQSEALLLPHHRSLVTHRRALHRVTRALRSQARQPRFQHP